MIKVTVSDVVGVALWLAVFAFSAAAIANAFTR
jgi:hypothetical protein